MLLFILEGGGTVKQQVLLATEPSPAPGSPLPLAFSFLPWIVASVGIWPFVITDVAMTVLSCGTYAHIIGLWSLTGHTHTRSYLAFKCTCHLLIKNLDSWTPWLTPVIPIL